MTKVKNCPDFYNSSVVNISVTEVFDSTVPSKILFLILFIVKNFEEKDIEFLKEQLDKNSHNKCTFQTSLPQKTSPLSRKASMPKYSYDEMSMPKCLLQKFQVLK